MSIKNATQKNHSGRMNGRNIVLLLGSALFLLLGALSLQPQSFDIGDDPERIEVVDIKQVTTDGGYILMDKKWSPDGKYFTASKDLALYVFDEEGRIVKKFNKTLFEKWSPDSKRILSGMMLLNVETGETRRIIEGEGYEPAFLPSGDKVIYNSQEGLSVVDINTGAIQTILAAQNYNFSDIFYVSAEKIFYLKNERKIDIRPHLYKYNSLAKKEYKLRSATIYGTKYFITPSGKVIIEAGYDAGTNSRLYIDENGEVIGRLPAILDSVYNAISPETCSSNGKLVLVEGMEIKDDRIYKGDLFIVSMDGKKKKRLTYSDDVIEEYARWSPKGNKIVFNDDARNIFLMTLRVK